MPLMIENSNNPKIAKGGNLERGFTLIEILVAMLILSIGLLGIASMQVQGMRNNQSAYLKSQASLLAYDIADRIRMNRTRALAGDYTPFDTKGQIPADPGCMDSANGCSAANHANSDLAEWSSRINGTVSGISMLPDAQGLISVDAANVFTVSVNWQETQWDEDSNTNALANQSFTVTFNL